MRRQRLVSGEARSRDGTRDPVTPPTLRSHLSDSTAEDQQKDGTPEPLAAGKKDEETLLWKTSDRNQSDVPMNLPLLL